MKLIKFITILLVLISFPACKRYTFEKAGDRADEIIDNVKDGDPILKKKGPLEKTGEAVDDVLSGEDDG